MPYGHYMLQLLYTLKSATITLYAKMNLIGDTKTLELAKSEKEMGNICDRLWRICQCVDK